MSSWGGEGHRIAYVTKRWGPWGRLKSATCQCGHVTRWYYSKISLLQAASLHRGGIDRPDMSWHW